MGVSYGNSFDLNRYGSFIASFYVVSASCCWVIREGERSTWVMTC